MAYGKKILEIKPPLVGSLVKFYDCHRANKDQNHSGAAKYWSVGMVVNRRITEKVMFCGIELGGDDVVDIQLQSGRISKGHFANAVTLANQVMYY